MAQLPALDEANRSHLSLWRLLSTQGSKDQALDKSTKAGLYRSSQPSASSVPHCADTGGHNSPTFLLSARGCVSVCVCVCVCAPAPVCVPEHKQKAVQGYTTVLFYFVILGSNSWGERPFKSTGNLHMYITYSNRDIWS